MRRTPLIEPLPSNERLSEEDMATRREGEFLADALAAHELRAAGGEPIRRGVCTNCGEPCNRLTVYCDAACREDHEARIARHARQRKSLG
jgi:hypothetical protein